MNYTQLFTSLLQSSADALLWSIQQVSEDMLYTISQKKPESWPVVRYLMHVQYNEEQVVLPCMRQWLSAEYAAHYRAKDSKQIAYYREYERLAQDEEIAWKQEPTLATLQTKFQEGRKEQIALLPQFSPQDWEETRETVWGQVTLRWAITKTYQHTLEHSDSILKHALYGNKIRGRIASSY